MKWLNRIATMVLLGTLVIGCSNINAADQTNNAAKPGITPPWGGRVVKEINWDQLPLSDVVNSLRGEFPDFNFLATRPVQSESVTMILHRVTLEEIFKALEPATEGRVKVSWDRNDRLVVFEAPPKPVSIDPYMCRVFNLSKFLDAKEGQEADALESVKRALEDGWKMLREANGEQSETTPKLSFHPGANLLIVVARPFEMSVAEDLVKQLQGSAPARTIPVPPDLDREKKSKPIPKEPAPPGRP